MIEQLQIHQLRNLQAITLALKPYNLIVGKNGSGKTSLLEAVFLLSGGKSFRHHEPRRYVSHHAISCTVWAKTAHATLAVQKQLDDKGLATTWLKQNNQIIKTQSALSLALPVLLLDPSGMTILEEGGSSHRQLLDWLVFHMKPQFYDHWLSYQRLLKQRNALLKTTTINQYHQQMNAWDYQLSMHAQHLHEYRQAVFTSWVGHFNALITRLLPKYQGQLQLSYQAGFDEKRGLFYGLQERLRTDGELGYTRIGAHRADVMVSLKCTQSGLKTPAVTVLSRGEKKLLIVALKLAQLQTLCHEKLTQTTVPVVLIDDIDSELDEAAIDVVLEVALALPCQPIITSLHRSMDKRIKQKITNIHGHCEDYQCLLMDRGWIG